MRGEFVNVWQDTYREIWSPLAAQAGVPADIFSQLYLEMSSALREPTGQDQLNISVGDALQLREAFDRALALAATVVDRATAEEAFELSGAIEYEDLHQRRVAVEEALEHMIGDKAEASRTLSVALSQITADAKRRAEARERLKDAIVNDTQRSRKAFEQVTSVEIVGERSLVEFLESAYELLDDLGGDELSNSYFVMLAAFIEKYSLRYDLRRPCTLCPTLPGVFASLVSDLRTITSQDAHLDALMKDVEESIRDLRIDCSDRRIKTSIQKQVNLLEALGRAYPGINRKTLGAISKQLKNWPHDEVMLALQSVYTFTCDYPGIRHGGTAANARRAVDMRDMVAVSILLAGFAPYLVHGINPDVVYRRD